MHLLERRGTELESVVLFVSLQHGLELLLVLLTGVESVPSMVHMRLKSVRVTGFFTLDVHRGNGTVLPVLIVGVPNELAEIVILANPSVPELLELTVVESFRGTSSI